MSFIDRTAPELDNQFGADRVLRTVLQHHMPADLFDALEDLFHTAGARQQKQYEAQQGAYSNVPASAYTPWGAETRRPPVPESWTNARASWVPHGLLHRAQAEEHGPHSRMVQMGLVHLMAPEAPGLMELVATSDIALHTLLRTGTADHLDTVIPRLTSRTPSEAILADLWGIPDPLGNHSDALRATATEQGWRLNGRVDTHAATYPDAALVLAHDGNDVRHLFLVDTLTPENGVHIGAPFTSAVHRDAPAATLRLQDTTATHLQAEAPRHGPARTLQHIWHAVLTVSHLRRTMALARGAAETWNAQGQELAYNPLVQETLADMQARYESAFHLTYRCVRLLDAPDADEALINLLAPLAALHATHQAEHVDQRAMHVFGRLGTRRDTGLMAHLNQGHRATGWHASPHHLAVEIAHRVEHNQQLGLLRDELKHTMSHLSIETLIGPMKTAVLAFRDAHEWSDYMRQEGGEALEAGAYRFAVTLSHALSIGYMIEHGQWALQHHQDGRAAAAVERFSQIRINHITDLDPHDAYVLTWDFNCPTLFECHSGTAGDAVKDGLESIFG